MDLPRRPTNERERLSMLHSCGVLDTDPEPAYDDIARIATQVCGCPMGLVSLVDESRQWFKARIGFSPREGPRDQAFCAHAILTPDRPMVLRDALADPRFADHPAVTGYPHVRFYAGVPLVLDGAAVGTLCVFDQVPRDLTPAQLEALTMLARQVTNELDLRRRLASLRSNAAPPAAPPGPADSQRLTVPHIRRALLPTDMVAGRYRVGEILGVGGMGLVVGATDIIESRAVAIKFLLPAARFDPHMLDRFVREARALMRVRGEHVARILDAGNLGNGAPFIVMERLVGEDLDMMLERRRTIPPLEAAAYVLQACAGVERVHAAGLVHRDIKPPNLFLAERDGAPPIVKVLDFGVAKHRPDGEAGLDASSETTLVGSPHYMPPEAMVIGNSIDGRADVWALGCVLYELLVGERPFEAETIADVCRLVIFTEPLGLRAGRPDIPHALDAIVRRCLKKQPRDRYQTAGELARDLAAFLGV